jgi:hypothetical protein
MVRVFQSCLTARTEPDRGISGLRELEIWGIGGLPVMDELEPLERQAPLRTFRWRSCPYQSRYADSLSVLGSEISVRVVIIGKAVHINIPRSSIGEYFAQELVIVLMHLNPGTFVRHGPILAKPLSKSRNYIGIVWLLPTLFEFKQNFGSSERTLTVTFPLVLAFGSH